MLDTAKKLSERMRRGEDESLELKSVRFRGRRVSAPESEGLADEIAAFANTQGGVLVFGINDKTRDVEGLSLDQLDAVDQHISAICDQRIDPPVHFLSCRMNLPDWTGASRAVLEIKIPRSLFVHQSPHGFFYRQGRSIRKMSHELIFRSILQCGESRLHAFEGRSVPLSGLSDLAPSLRKRYAAHSNEPDEAALLRRGLLVREEDGPIHASVAGVLLCCEQPERFLSRAHIEAVRYRGTKQNINYQMDAQKIHGPLNRQIDQAMAFLGKNQTVMAAQGHPRIEKPQFDERAVFEAIVNAVAHRDYSISGSGIRFFIFDDRLEIYSPGLLPGTVTVDNIAYRQVTRNELITSLLAETPIAEMSGDVGRGCYMEKRGDGVRIIMDRGEAHSGKKPVYRLIDNSELLLTIFSASMKSSDED